MVCTLAIACAFVGCQSRGLVVDSAPLKTTEPPRCARVSQRLVQISPCFYYRDLLREWPSREMPPKRQQSILDFFGHRPPKRKEKGEIAAFHLAGLPEGVANRAVAVPTAQHGDSENRKETTNGAKSRPPGFLQAEDPKPKAERRECVDISLAASEQTAGAEEDAKSQALKREPGASARFASGVDGTTAAAPSCGALVGPDGKLHPEKEAETLWTEAIGASW